MASFGKGLDDFLVGSVPWVLDHLFCYSKKIWSIPAVISPFFLLH